MTTFVELAAAWRCAASPAMISQGPGALWSQPSQPHHIGPTPAWRESSARSPDGPPPTIRAKHCSEEVTVPKSCACCAGVQRECPRGRFLADMEPKGAHPRFGCVDGRFGFRLDRLLCRGPCWGVDRLFGL